MFERLNDPNEAYNFKLGAALKMEQTVLEKILADSIDEAHDDRVKQLFEHHADETREQIHNLERVFQRFGWEVDDSPCPAIEALHKEAKTNVKKTDDSIVDTVILSGAVETEHHEIAVYESLITLARAMGRDDVCDLLQQNLEQEQHTLEEAKSALERVAAATPAQAA
jgi:ferritin-like metal-binding protein YciE